MHTGYSITYKYTLGTVTFEGNVATPTGKIRVVQKIGLFLHHAYNCFTICLTSNGDDMSYTWGSLDSFIFTSDLSWIIFLLEPWLCLLLVLVFIFLVHSDACFMSSAMSRRYSVCLCLLTWKITMYNSTATLDTHTLTSIVTWKYFIFVGNLLEFSAFSFPSTLPVFCVVYVLYFILGESSAGSVSDTIMLFISCLSCMRTRYIYISLFSSWLLWFLTVGLIKGKYF